MGPTDSLVFRHTCGCIATSPHSLLGLALLRVMQLWISAQCSIIFALCNVFNTLVSCLYGTLFFFFHTHFWLLGMQLQTMGFACSCGCLVLMHCAVQYCGDLHLLRQTFRLKASCRTMKNENFRLLLQQHLSHLHTLHTYISKFLWLYSLGIQVGNVQPISVQRFHMLLEHYHGCILLSALSS